MNKREREEFVNIIKEVLDDRDKENISEEYGRIVCCVLAILCSFGFFIPPVGQVISAFLGIVFIILIFFPLD